MADEKPVVVEVVEPKDKVETQPELKEHKIGAQVFKHKDDADLVQQLSKAQENATAEIARQREQSERLAASLAAKDRAAAPEGKLTPEQVKSEYWRLMDDDPVKAHRFLSSHALFGGEVPPDNIPTVIREFQETDLLVRTSNEAGKFLMQHPEFPGGKAADLIMEELGRNNQDYTAQNVEYHYLRLVNDGKITPLTAEEVAAESGGRVSKAPPSLGGGSRGPGEVLQVTEAELLSMPKDEYEKLLKKAGLQ